VPNDYVDDLRIVGNVYVPSEVTSVVEDILVDFSIPILDEVQILLRVQVMWMR